MNEQVTNILNQNITKTAKLRFRTERLQEDA